MSSYQTATGRDPLDVLRVAVESYAPYQGERGEVGDPVFGEPTQYGTPYFGLCNAVLALKAEGDRRQIYVDRALRALRVSVEHVADIMQPATASGFNRETWSVSRGSHRDFFWPPVMKTYLILRRLNAPGLQDISQKIETVDVLESFRTRPPSNWASVWLSGEWLRVREGMSPHSIEDVDRWLKVYFRSHIIPELGFYQEPGHPNSYDLFTRYHLADMLMEGYDGALRPRLAELMRTGLERSFAVQLSDGSLASAHRSTGQTWNLGAECAYFTHAANFFRESDPRLSAKATEAAAWAFSSFRRWQRTDGPYSPVENCLPPEYRVGYEGYTADGHYGNLAMAFLAVAMLNGFGDGELPGIRPRDPFVRIENDPTFRAIAHNGEYSAHANAFPAPHYDGFGLVDLTVGPDRILQFASSAKRADSGRFYNLGLAHRPKPSRTDLHVMAHDDFALVNEIRQGDSPTSFALEARPKGSYYTYWLEVDVLGDGVRVRESTPGLVNYKTLLIPYLRDAGTGTVTEVRESTSEIRLIHGSEQVSVSFDLPVEYVLNLPFGFENRRGLCGLIRVDFRDATEGIAYRVAAV